MRAALALCALFLAFSGGAAIAGEKAGDPGTNVEMPFLIAPMCVDGKLTGYAYISSKVVTGSRDASLEVRNKIPFIQDAFVRDVNASPIAKTTDPKTVDNVALIARMTADVKRIVGAAKISSVVIIQVQITELHPSEALVATPPS
jgi:hypothetical protein